MNDQDLPEDGANPMAAALAAGAAADAAADEEGMVQDDTPVAVCNVGLDDTEVIDDEFSTDDDLEEEDLEDELDDEELAAIRNRNKMEQFFAEDPLTEELSELDVLTLEEAAIYLKIEFGDLRRMVKEQGLPGRKIGDQWRFLRGAIADWLRAPGGSTVPAAQPERPARSERPARAARPAFEERPAFDDRPQREERPRRRFPDVEVNVDEGYPPRSQPPRPRPQFRSQNQFGGGAEAGGHQGGAGQGGYPPPRRGRYEGDQQQQPPQGEYRPPRKRPPFRAQEGGPTGGNQFGGAQGGAGQEGGRRFVGGPKKSKREALGNQRFKRLDRRRFGSDQGE